MKKKTFKEKVISSKKFIKEYLDSKDLVYSVIGAAVTVHSSNYTELKEKIYEIIQNCFECKKPQKHCKFNTCNGKLFIRFKKNI